MTALGTAVSTTDAKLDAHVKNILAFKPVLARIFKETIIECHDMSYEEIESCIEGDVQIDVIGLNPGTSNPSKISGNAQEDTQDGEGKITYDIRTFIRIPRSNCLVGVKILVDLEAQKQEKPGYDIAERAIYYCSRMLSSQLSVEFENSSADKVKYGNLKKVYSIWICTETSQKRANTVERYTIHRSVWPYDKCPDIPRYDLMEAIIVNISKKHDTENSSSNMINMLTRLFDESLASGEKLKILKADYGLPVTTEFEREVLDMTAYAARLLNEGLEQGRSEERTEMICHMLQSGKTPKQIAEFCGIDMQEIEAVEQALLATVSE